MFYAYGALVLKKGPFCIVWKAVYGKGWKISRKTTVDFPVCETCDDLVDSLVGAKGQDGGVAKGFRLSLYLISQLSFGVTRIVYKQAEYLFNDAEEVKKSLNPFLLRKFAEKRKRDDEDEPDARRKRVKTVSKAASSSSSFLSFDIMDKEAAGNIILPEISITPQLLERITLKEAALIGQLEEPLFGDDFGEAIPQLAERVDELEESDERRRSHQASSQGASSQGASNVRVTAADASLAASPRGVDPAAHPKTGETTKRMDAVEEPLAVSTPPPDQVAEKLQERAEEVFAMDVTAEGLGKEAEGRRESSPPGASVQLILSPLGDGQGKQSVHPRPKRAGKMIVDRQTVLSKKQMQAQLEDYSSTVRTREELMPHVHNRFYRTLNEMFDYSPYTLKRNPILDGVIEPPVRSEPLMTMAEALAVPPGEKPPSKRPRRARSPSTDEESASEGSTRLRQQFEASDESRLLEVERASVGKLSVLQSPQKSLSTLLNEDDREAVQTMADQRGREEVDEENATPTKKSVLLDFAAGEEVAQMSPHWTPVGRAGDVLNDTPTKKSVLLDELSVGGDSLGLPAERGRLTDHGRSFIMGEGSGRPSTLQLESTGEVVEHYPAADALLDEVRSVAGSDAAGEDLVARMARESASAPYTPPKVHSAVHVYRFEQQFEQLLTHIIETMKKRDVQTVQFADVLGRCSRAEAAKNFGNLLELAKLSKVTVAQREFCGPIEISVRSN